MIKQVRFDSFVPISVQPWKERLCLHCQVGLSASFWLTPDRD
ncbi:hypothetical protein EPYR_00721 [Erwinia pyrifoliae DSM 12163]|nr:hypothetical protein EPYR_00721 [Erwinia pyrifoliae DSM 12163]